MKIKLFLKKFLICLIVVVLLFNFLGTPHAEANLINKLDEGIGGVVDGILGILTWLPRILFTAVASAIMGIMGGIATTFGYVDDSSGISKYSENAPKGEDNISVLGVADIFFNRLMLTDINIFNVDPGIGDSNHPLVQMRTQIALWYYVMRIIAISVLLAILIYVAIRMSIATIAEKKASYKKMLVDWTASIALVFLLHYMIVGVVNLNDALVRIISSVSSDLVKGDDCLSAIVDQCFSIQLTTGLGANIVLGMLVIQTLAFLIFYIKRMLTISFLIIISPLITITYSVDRMGDGKAQALNAWFKEFVFSIIIQPFHCIMYLAFTNIALGLISGPGSGMSSLAASVLAAMCIQFIWNGEKIVKQIFGIQVSKSIGDAVASAAIAGTMISKATKAGTKVATKGVSTTLKLGGKAGGIVGQTANALAKTTAGKKVSNFVKGTGAYTKFTNFKDNTKKTVHDIADRVKETGVGKFAGKTITGVKKFAKSDLGQTYKRAIKNYAANSVGVAAGIMTMGAAYGSSADASLLTSAGAAIGAGVMTANATKGLLNRKVEHFEDKVSNNQNAIKEISGTEMSASEMGSIADAKEKKGDFKDLKDDRKDTKKALTSKLKAQCPVDSNGDPIYSDSELEAKAEGALRAMELGVFDGDLNMDKIAKDLGMDKADLQGVVSDYGSNFVLNQVASDNKAIDDLAGEAGYHKRALAAIDNMKEETSTSSSYTEEQIENATENAVEDVVEHEDRGELLAQNKGTLSEFKKLQNMLQQLMVMLPKDANNNPPDKANVFAEIMKNEMSGNVPSRRFDASSADGGDGLDSSMDIKASDIQKALIQANLNPSSPTFENDVNNFVTNMIYTGSDGKSFDQSKLDGNTDQIEARKEYITEVTKHTIYKQFLETKIIDLGERQVNP